MDKDSDYMSIILVATKCVLLFDGDYDQSYFVDREMALRESKKYKIQ